MWRPFLTEPWLNGPVIIPIELILTSLENSVQNNMLDYYLQTIHGAVLHLSHIWLISFLDI